MSTPSGIRTLVVGDGESGAVATTIAALRGEFDSAAVVDSVPASTLFDDGVEAALSDVDCVVLVDGDEDIDSSAAAVRAVEADLPVVAFCDAAGETFEAAVAGPASDVVPRGVPSAEQLLARRVAAAVDRRRLERAHAETQSLTDALFEQIPLHLYVKDIEGRHLRVSSAYTANPDRFIGKTDAELYPSEETDRTLTDDIRVIRDGEPILHKREPVVDDDPERFSVTYLREHYAEDGDFDGQEYDGWVLTSKVPWYDADGEIAGLLGVTFDISQREEYRRRLERQNERLDEFAGVLSHDLRNPLNVASGYLELAREECDSDHLEQVSVAHERIAERIESVLMLARQGRDVSDPDPVPLATVVDEAWTATGGRFGGGRFDDADDPTLTVAENLGTVDADSDRLRELFENLFSNAVVHGGDDVTVSVGLLDDGDGFYVADDGPGIPATQRRTVFDRGVTTADDGHGIGLSVVARIADAHGWSVVAVAGTDGGARFEIRGVSRP